MLVHAVYRHDMKTMMKMRMNEDFRLKISRFSVEEELTLDRSAPHLP